MIMMENQRNLSTIVGFCLLPLDLIHNILFNLALPEIVRLKSVSKSVAAVISDPDFIRQINLRSSLTNWLFVCKKKWRRDTVLHGFTDRSDQWFRIPVTDYLISAVHPSEDLYFLTASANIFLFVSNTSRVVISVNLVNKTVRNIPTSPLGPRGTSSWRRSGMKLVAGPTGSDSFRFMFAELHDSRPILFIYDSQTDMWQSIAAQENDGNMPSEDHFMFLNAINEWSESVIVAVGSKSDAPPLAIRPRFDGRENDDPQQLAVGYTGGNVINRLRVYGDGNMMIIKSNGSNDGNTRVWMLSDIEVWGLSLNCRGWDSISKVPNQLMEQIKKPFEVMKGCLEERNGVIKVVLMSNYDGLWDIIWLSYDIGKSYWRWVPIPDCKMKGLNMAGIAFSSGLTLL